ncbi:MAG: methyltransferase domain-containing protein [Lachnospiraceae bacterium]|nr:methyltransferase domain-containing protein [Lachnospiraceae bacterium]
MEAYTDFARVYDELMDETPYMEWCRWIVSKLWENGIRDGLVLDLGCGTGAMTELIYTAGYDMIGVDASADMLEQAVRKKEEANIDVLYLMQEMEAFELYGTVCAVVCCCDCINYLTDPEALLRCFKLVNNYLDPGGLFLFDFNTVHKYRDEIGDTVIAENREDCSFIWENAYDEDSRMNEYDLTLFMREADGRYGKHTETHMQRGYELAEIKELLERAGLRFEGAYDDYTEKEPGEKSGRIVVCARECGKAGRDSV